MIPRTFHDGNPEDRDYVSDMWSWLQDQPQDAWLMFVRTANWDTADLIFEEMLADPRCDRAVAALIFWGAGPDNSVSGLGEWNSDRLIKAAVEGERRGLYASQELALSRYELLDHVQRLIVAIRQLDGPPTFRLPRQLCGPFEGKDAALPKRYDDQTEADLQELLGSLDADLPRSEAEYRETGDFAYHSAFYESYPLPRLRETAAKRLSTKSDADYLEAIYGTAESYDAARHPKPVRRRIGAFTLLMVFGVIAIGGALVLHRIRTGSW